MKNRKTKKEVEGCNRELYDLGEYKSRRCDRSNSMGVES